VIIGGKGLIGIDWGSTNFRAFRFNDAGEVFDRRFSPEGVISVHTRLFGDVLREKVSDWLEAGETRILLCGMIGSRQGWVEAKYVSCPVGIADLATAVIEVPFSGAEVLLIPGVSGIDSCGVPEVMRGEETEVMGMLQACKGTGLACLPGTHSKWIRFTDETIVSFSTCMTGELYAALRQNTSLARIMTFNEARENEAFLRGVARSIDAGGLLHHLFSVRTLTLMDQLKEDAAASYLSGLLIGHEVRAAMPAGAHIHLVGDSQLCSLYAQAIQTCGGSFTLESAHAAARGLAAIGRRMLWI
jgi:2-dehydro-3-deoxygalactonokinase